MVTSNDDSRIRDSYKGIRKQADEHIDKEAAKVVGKSLIDGFKAYMSGENAPEKLHNGVAAKGIANGSAFVLAVCASHHGRYTSEDMKVMFLAYFDRMYDYYIKCLVLGEDEGKNEEKIKGYDD
jgi:hypothetical protein